MHDSCEPFIEQCSDQDSDGINQKLLVISLVGYKFSLTFAATERPEPGQISLCIFIDDITLPRGYM